jgi:GAF domain-containing protein
MTNAELLKENERLRRRVASLERTPRGQQGDAAEVERLRVALTEAVGQQTATAEILRVISSSPADLQPVLDRMAESAARFCQADDASIFRLEGERLVSIAHHGPVPSPIGFVVPVGSGTVGGRSVRERPPIHVADLQAEDEEFPEGAAIAREVGFRATLSVPLLREGVPLGTIHLRRAVVAPFTDKQIALLLTFADQAVIAIENVRLFNETKEALERQTATAEILRAISQAQTDLQPVFDAIASSALRLFRAWTASVYRFDGTLLHVGATRGGPPDAERHLRDRYPRPPLETSSAGRAILQRAVQNTPDYELAASPELREIARVRGYRAVLSVPMLREGVPIGAISVTRAVPPD